jgi:hypothetical protein
LWRTVMTMAILTIFDHKLLTVNAPDSNLLQLGLSLVSVCNNIPLLTIYCINEVKCGKPEVFRCLYKTSFPGLHLTDDIKKWKDECARMSVTWRTSTTDCFLTWKAWYSNSWGTNDEDKGNTFPMLPLLTCLSSTRHVETGRFDFVILMSTNTGKGSSVGIVQSYGLDILGSIPSNVKRFFSIPQRPNRP